MAAWTACVHTLRRRHPASTFNLPCLLHRCSNTSDSNRDTGGEQRWGWLGGETEPDAVRFENAFSKGCGSFRDATRRLFFVCFAVCLLACLPFSWPTRRPAPLRARALSICFPLFAHDVANVYYTASPIDGSKRCLDICYYPPAMRLSCAISATRGATSTRGTF